MLISYAVFHKESIVITDLNFPIIIVTVFWKTDHLHTRTEIHVLPVHDRHTHALSRNTKHWTIDSQVCFYRRLFNAVKPRGCISWPGLGCINRTARGTRLLLSPATILFIRVTVLDHRRSTLHSIFQISISRNMKCA